MADDNRTEVVVPTIGESITSAFIASWFKQVGDYVKEGETLLEVDSDKASLEVPSPVSGKVVELAAEEGDEVPIGGTIAVVDTSAEPPAEAAAAPAPSAAPTSSEDSSGGGREATPSSKGPQTGPAARQAAAEKGVDIRGVSGSGVRGRVLSRDVNEASSSARQAPEVGPSAPVDNSARTERVVMSPLRRTIARRLVEAQQTAAMLTTFNEIDMSGVINLRKEYQDRYVKRYGHKLGFMSFFVKAVIEGLKAYPAVNAEIDESDPKRPAVIYKNYYNIGVAVSTDRGLMVPVVRDVDQMSFSEVEQSIGELARRGRDGKLRMEDFQDGTFTISNGGVYGSLMSSPILNPPQSGILGMHKIQDRPMVINGEIRIRPMMYLALSYDHRIVDGKGAVTFLVRVKEALEDPRRLLMDL
jgi:2-oxoglutarate dehydrogenase E2 component (dihydrolipoamide succinyltransferase)